MQDIKLVTYNVRGLNNDLKCHEIFYYLHKKGADIVFLQETYSQIAKEKLWSAEWSNKIWFSHGASDARGVAILFNKKLKIVIHNTILDPGGCFLMLYVTL